MPLGAAADARCRGEATRPIVAPGRGLVLHVAVVLLAPLRFVADAGGGRQVAAQLHLDAGGADGDCADTGQRRGVEWLDGSRRHATAAARARRVPRASVDVQSGDSHARWLPAVEQRSAAELLGASAPLTDAQCGRGRGGRRHLGVRGSQGGATRAVSKATAPERRGRSQRRGCRCEAIVIAVAARNRLQVGGWLRIAHRGANDRGAGERGALGRAQRRPRQVRVGHAQRWGAESVEGGRCPGRCRGRSALVASHHRHERRRCHARHQRGERHHERGHDGAALLLVVAGDGVHPDRGVGSGWRGQLGQHRSATALGMALAHQRRLHRPAHARVFRPSRRSVGSLRSAGGCPRAGVALHGRVGPPQAEATDPRMGR